jgi:hypothetical protein
MCLVGVGLIQILVFYYQLHLFRRSLRTAENAANVAFAQANAIAAGERAYVKMSHNPPGIDIRPESGVFVISIEIKNHGRTPATVSDVVLEPMILPTQQALPTVPTYTRQGGSRICGFLVANEPMLWVEQYDITSEKMMSVKADESNLYLIGHVDYIDQFGRRYRGGFARRYVPTLDGPQFKNAPQRNNLNFVLQTGYNYDRERIPGEGDDWT